MMGALDDLGCWCYGGKQAERSDAMGWSWRAHEEERMPRTAREDGRMIEGASRRPAGRTRGRRRWSGFTKAASLALLASTAAAQGTNPLNSDPTMVAFSLAPSTSTFFTIPSPPSSTLTYITLNICAAPSGNLTQSSPLAFDISDVLFVSNSSSRQSPGPSNRPPLSGRQGGSAGTAGGFANLTIVNSQGLWIGVNAPSAASSDVWGFQIGVSSTNALHVVNGFPAFRYEDSDNSSALLTGADSSLYIPSDQTSPPSLQAVYPIVAPSTTSLPYGLSASTCALQTVFNSSNSPLSSGVVPVSNVQVSLTTRNLGIGRPSSQRTADNNFRLTAQETGQRPQYAITGLQKGTNYTAWLFEPAGQVNGVQLGRLWPSINFATKSTSSCRLLYNLDFCPSVAYSVPTPGNLPLNNLISFYSSLVTPHVQNFTGTISTYPCANASVDGRWSYVSSCVDCVSAYRDWACAVTMPRCTDVPPAGTDLDNDSELIKRQANNGQGQGQDDKTSATKSDDEGPGDYGGLIPLLPQTVLVRTNATISRSPGLASDALSASFPGLSAATIGNSPFPYGEVPPCISTCTLVAASCPYFLGWNCPLSSSQSSSGTLSASYGVAKEDISGRDVRGGEETARGTGGDRAADRFGNVWCNALGSDMAYARMGAATSLGRRQGMVMAAVAAVVGAVLVWVL